METKENLLKEQKILETKLGKVLAGNSWEDRLSYISIVLATIEIQEIMLERLNSNMFGGLTTAAKYTTVITKLED